MTNAESDPGREQPEEDLAQAAVQHPAPDQQRNACPQLPRNAQGSGGRGLRGSPLRLAVASAAMPADAGVRKTVAPAAMTPVMVPMAMIPTMVPATPAAVTKIQRAIDRIGRVSLVDVTTRPSRARGQGQTEKNQGQNSSHQYSTALHPSLRFLVSIARSPAPVSLP